MSTVLVRMDERQRKYAQASLTPIHAGESYEDWRIRQVNDIIAVADAEIEEARNPPRTPEPRRRDAR